MCGGHGDLHGDHCHCDTGFEPSADGKSCASAGQHDEEMGSTDMGSTDMGSADMSSTDMGSTDMGSTDMGGPTPFTFAPAQVRAAVGTDDGGKGVWLLKAQGGGNNLDVELYESLGAPASAGSVELTAKEADYATCGTCMVLQTGCAAHGDHFHCAKTFMPRPGGRVQLDVLGKSGGESIKGALLDVVFQEVTIAQDYTTQVIPNGATLLLNSWTFDATLEALGGEEECSGHGHLHGAECHCDTGYKPDPADATKCIAE